jgi:hypothetical protein
MGLRLASVAMSWCRMSDFGRKADQAQIATQFGGTARPCC